MMSNSAIPVQRYRRRLQFRSLDMSVCLPVHRPSLTHSILHSFRAATVWWAIDKVEVDRDNYGALVFISDIGMDGRGPGNFRAEVLSRHASSLNIQQTTLTKWPDIAHIEDLLELASCTLFRDSIEHEHLAPKENNVKSERASARFGSRYAERGELWSHRTIGMRERKLLGCPTSMRCRGTTQHMEKLNILNLR